MQRAQVDVFNGATSIPHKVHRRAIDADELSGSADSTVDSGDTERAEDISGIADSTVDGGYKEGAEELSGSVDLTV